MSANTHAWKCNAKKNISFRSRPALCFRTPTSKAIQTHQEFKVKCKSIPFSGHTAEIKTSTGKACAEHLHQTRPCTKLVAVVVVVIAVAVMVVVVVSRHLFGTSWLPHSTICGVGTEPSHHGKVGPVGREKNEVRVHDVEVGVHDVDDVDLGSGGVQGKGKGVKGLPSRLAQRATKTSPCCLS